MRLNRKEKTELKCDGSPVPLPERIAPEPLDSKEPPSSPLPSPRKYPATRSPTHPRKYYLCESHILSVAAYQVSPPQSPHRSTMSPPRNCSELRSLSARATGYSSLAECKRHAAYSLAKAARRYKKSPFQP